MQRTSTIRAISAALALVACAASMSAAQYRAQNTLARGDTTVTRHRASTGQSARVAHPATQYGTSRGNFYIGVAAGASMPTGNFGDFYESGWAATIPVGWRPANGPLGIRFDLAYSTWGGATVGGVKLQSAAVWDGMLDATLDMPFGTNRTSSFYLVGGGGAHYFPEYGQSSSGNTLAGDTTTTPPTGPGGPGYQLNAAAPATTRRSSTTRFGLNGGAGLSFGLPHAALFLETRYVTVFTKNEHTNYWPVFGGIKWSMR